MSKTSPTSLTVCKPTISGSTISTTLTTWDRWVPRVVPALTCFTVHNRKVCSCQGEVRITVFLFTSLYCLGSDVSVCTRLQRRLGQYHVPRFGRCGCGPAGTWIWAFMIFWGNNLLFFLISATLFLSLFPSQHNTSTSATSADNQQQPVDVAVFHLLPSHRELFCPQHVCWRGGGELPQVPSTPGGGGSQEAWGETSAAHGEKEEE